MLLIACLFPESLNFSPKLLLHARDWNLLVLWRMSWKYCGDKYLRWNKPWQLLKDKNLGAFGSGWQEVQRSLMMNSKSYVQHAWME